MRSRAVPRFLALLLVAGASSARQAATPARVGVPGGGVEVQTLQPHPDYPELGFGGEVCLTGDQLLVAVPEGTLSRPGAVQVFDRTPGGFVFRQRLAPLVPTADSSAVLGGPFGAFAPGSSVTVELEDDLLVWGADRATWLHARDLGGPLAWGLAQTLSDCLDATCTSVFQPAGRRLRSGRLAMAGTVYDPFCNEERLLAVYRVEEAGGVPILLQTHAVDGGNVPSYSWGAALDVLESTAVVGDPFTSTVHVFQLDPLHAAIAPPATAR